MQIKINSLIWLLLGLVLLGSTHMTYSIGVLGWFAYVPFLYYLAKTSGWQSRLWFFLMYVVAWSVIVYKITTHPIPVFVIPMYSIPIAAFHLPGFLIWARFRNEKLGSLLFPALMVVMEWIQYTFTPFGSWGAAAYTQMDNIVLMQSLSLFGMAGLGFLIYWVNAVIAQEINDKRFSLKKVMLPGIILIAVLSFGALRYDLGKSYGKATLKIAAVGTDSEVGGPDLPTAEQRRKNAAILFDRTKEAAQADAKLIVWNEGAAAVLPNEEDDWQDSLINLAAEQQITLIASYILMLSENPFRYENKYLFLQPDGLIAETYFKHEPVPGEPAVKGRAPFEVHSVDDITVAGAICYDYDFPYIAQAHGKLNADLVALPSSDWRGIDPIHTKMAAFRAVEQGFSVLRSTRFGLSGAIGPYGELVAQMSSFDENDRIMLAHLPKGRVFTLYRWIGDSFVYLCVVFVVFFIFSRLLTLDSRS